jgi:hypothetical protein
MRRIDHGVCTPKVYTLPPRSHVQVFQQSLHVEIYGKQDGIRKLDVPMDSTIVA